MSKESKIEATAAEVKSRREFVKTAAKVAVTAPAAVMLLNASTKAAKASETYGSLFDDVGLTGDDFNDDLFVHPGDDLF